jgi:hypothetical protein
MDSETPTPKPAQNAGPGQDNHPFLLPSPRSLTLLEGSLTLLPNVLIALESPVPQELRSAGER